MTARELLPTVEQFIAHNLARAYEGHGVNPECVAGASKLMFERTAQYFGESLHNLWAPIIALEGTADAALDAALLEAVRSLRVTFGFEAL